MRTITQEQFAELVELAADMKHSYMKDAECYEEAREIINLPDGVDDMTKGGWIVAAAGMVKDHKRKLKDLLKANGVEVK